MRGHDPQLAAATATQIGKKAFLSCIALQEVVIPTRKWAFEPFLDARPTRTGRTQCFLLCDNFEQPSWLKLLPTEGPDSDVFDEKLFTESPDLQTVHQGTMAGA